MNDPIEFYAGWTNFSIEQLVAEDHGLLARFTSLLVTSLDSIRDLRDTRIARTALAYAPECRMHGKGLVIPGKLVRGLHGTCGLFTGFDEIWCFLGELPAQPVNEHPIVAPLRLEAGEVPAGLVEWMNRSRCDLGLGDGIGLNYVTPSSELAVTIASR